MAKNGVGRKLRLRPLQTDDEERDECVIAARGRTVKRMGSFAFEKHYRVSELAGLWGLSAKTVTRMFAEEAGVIRVANEGNGKRKYATLSIPESIALRVHDRLGSQSIQATLMGGHPVRIIRLGDLHAET